MEEEELGIYEDKESGTDLSDSETVKSVVGGALDEATDENNNVDVGDEEGGHLPPVVTPVAPAVTPIPQAELESEEIKLNTNIEYEASHRSYRGERQQNRRGQRLSFDQHAGASPNQLRETTPTYKNSVDPALEIKGILKSRHAGETATSPSVRVSSVVNTVSDVRVEPSTPDVQQQHSENMKRTELLSAAKDIEYIQKKCVGTDTRWRRISSGYHDLSESPVLKAVRSANPASPRSITYHQNRPLPMVPLKAWKGYSGNVYFNPIKINRVSSAAGAIETVSRSQTTVHQVKATEAKRKRQQTAKPDLSSMAFHCDIPTKPVIIMDKETVMRKHDQDMQRDLEWIRNMENVGSLKIERGSGDSRTKERRFDLKSIHKGSVAHQLAKQRRTSAQQQPKTRSAGNRFSVSGDKFNAPPLYMNPLLRASTQYSQSRSRPLTGGSDVSPEGDRQLPLDQLKASLRGSTTTPVSPDMKSIQSRKQRGIQLVQSANTTPSYVKLSEKRGAGFGSLTTSSTQDRVYAPITA